MRERNRCSQCGTRPEEWGPDGRTQAYVAEVKRCRGCEELDRASESPQAKEGRGIHVVLRRP